VKALDFLLNTESKLELVDGRLIVSDDLENSLMLAKLLLEQTPAEDVVRLAPKEVWREALKSYQPLAPMPALSAGVSRHNRLRTRIAMDLFGELRGSGRVLSRDCVMRLGDDAFTPDIYAVFGQAALKQREYYLDGPADLAVEILLPGFEPMLSTRLLLYGHAGVKQLWLVEPHHRQFKVLVHEQGGYRLRHRREGGTIITPGSPRLRVLVDNLWLDDDAPTLTLLTPPPRALRRRGQPGIVWGQLPYRPRVAAVPEAIGFEEFISWAPEAKFELLRGEIVIGHPQGTRQVLGMLLMTHGARAAVRLMPKAYWQGAL
jgi:Uma2 family endonuclease